MKTVFSINEAQRTPAEFFLKLLHSGTNTHILHLQTKSYAEHKALETFYTEIIDLTDSLIEAFQGRHSQIIEYPRFYDTPIGTPLEELNLMSSYVIANRNVLGSDSEIQNLVDEIQALIDSTIYKLTFLK